MLTSETRAAALSSPAGITAPPSRLLNKQGLINRFPKGSRVPSSWCFPCPVQAPLAADLANARNHMLRPGGSASRPFSARLHKGLSKREPAPRLVSHRSPQPLFPAGDPSARLPLGVGRQGGF